MSNLVGNQGRLFGELAPGPDEPSFQVDNTSAAYYSSPYFLKHQLDLQPFPSPTVTPPIITLSSVMDPPGSTPFTGPFEAAKKISFHSVGDTGAAKNSDPTTEAGVADAMAADLVGPASATPAFFFHLGDVVYNFGEGKYYYDQFYEPFRAYDRPIFALAGNHDGMVFGNAPDTPDTPSLTAFLRNFCAPTAASSPDAGTLVRSTMTQPGVYFTLDAPCVSIIGLYSNVLDGPGVISSEGGMYPISDEQLAFLKSELLRLKADRAAMNRAIVLAVHHPPLSADSKHGGTVGLSNDIDTQCKAAGVWPDLVLSGHAHLYQRFTRTVKEGKKSIEIPYLVSGSGGFAATTPKTALPPAPVKYGDVTLEVDPIVKFGYLTVTVDLSGAVKTIHVGFTAPPTTGFIDQVTLNLATRTVS